VAPPAAAPATTSLPVVGHPRAVARAAALVADASVDQAEGVRGGAGGASRWQHARAAALAVVVGARPGHPVGDGRPLGHAAGGMTCRIYPYRGRRPPLPLALAPVGGVRPALPTNTAFF